VERKVMDKKLHVAVIMDGNGRWQRGAICHGSQDTVPELQSYAGLSTTHLK